jgi:cytochrome c biogenesis protein CcmG/thiol:disulfide interchange protein DsbE
MTLRRLLLTVLGLVIVAFAVTAMVRYTRRVEHDLTHASASGTTVKFLRERAAVPPFAAEDLAGRRISTSDFKNKVILVNFWATWCPPCREEIPALIALQEKYRDQLQVIGVSQDSGSSEGVLRFAQAHGINYPVVMTSPEIEKLFPNVYALPTSFLIDRDGRIAQKHVGMLNPSLTEVETRSLAGLDVDAKVELVEDEDKVRLENAAQANKIPGVDLSTLTPDQKALALQKLNSEHCTCGCGLTVAQCRLDDPSCNVSLPTAQAIVKQIAESK